MPSKDSHLFLVILLIIFLALLILTVAGYGGPLVLALVFTGLASPLYKHLKNFFRSENVAAFVTVFIVSLVIILPAFFFLTVLTNEAFHLFTITQSGFTENYSFQNAVTNLSAKFDVDLKSIIDIQLTPALKNLGLSISKEVGSLLSNALSLAINFFVMVIGLFYLLRDGRKFADFLLAISPLKTSDELDIYQTFIDTGKAVFYGTVLSALGQGILGGVGFFFAGLPSPILWGTLMGFLSLIPFLGAYIVFIPAAIYLFFSGHVVTAIIFLLYNILIVSTIDNIIKPKVVGAKMHIHTFPVLVAILGGLKFFGIAGLIYGPLILAVFLALLRVYLETQKSTHTHTAT
jgi:predicted PurR-regulated permease PerM